MTSEGNVLSTTQQHSLDNGHQSLSVGRIYLVVGWFLLTMHHPQEVFSLGHSLLVGGLGIMVLQLFQGLLEVGESSTDKDTQVYTIMANTK